MPEPRVLASLAGIQLVTLLMIASGAACDQCGYGTRATSKNWARCKRCGARVARKPMEDCLKLSSGGPHTRGDHDD